MGIRLRIFVGKWRGLLRGERVCCSVQMDMNADFIRKTDGKILGNSVVIVDGVYTITQELGKSAVVVNSVYTTVHEYGKSIRRSPQIQNKCPNNIKED